MKKPVSQSWVGVRDKLHRGGTVPPGAAVGHRLDNANSRSVIFHMGPAVARGGRSPGAPWVAT